MAKTRKMSAWFKCTKCGRCGPRVCFGRGKKVVCPICGHPDIVAFEPIDVQKVIHLHFVIGNGAMLDGHTHGLEAYGHPNLQIWAPSIFVHSAGRLLNAMSHAVINQGETFKVGEKCDYRPEWGWFTLEEEPDHEKNRALRIVPILIPCSECGGGECDGRHDQ